MRIGLSISGLADTADEARRAEEAGFDFVGCGEHVFFHGPTPNAFVALAAAAGATSRVRLVTSIALAPVYPGALFAKLTAALDVVSGGRLDLGVGAGGEYPAEFTAVGVDVNERFRRLDEALALLRRLGPGRPVTFDGEFTALDGVTLRPAPAQHDGPPVWMGGRGEGALRRAGRWADVWMPYLLDPARVRDGLEKVRDHAAAQGRDPRPLSGALLAWTAVDEDDAWARATGTAAVSTTYDQDFSGLADRYLLLGSPDRVLERLAEYARAGVEHVLFQVAASDAADRRRIIDTLTERVLPEAGRL
ncbi:LLM class flavin-dependent oxidoreductase [Streptomyces sp. M2CJ-2]|uniref:LLM class flavin-dependent oxidoreductase n=1 Tax=Streptomyces sp. M2CJ-2 TaxID=2803948 RepID=UPI001927C8A1|nr:LLM class flavin-dependent oxidoreductase [Streptomyces sp. M2CJ-2]MBL3668082.1 LLM class flavin-dependent oxidoreductase [Streptomyces sp. M2CJ-2]